MTGPAPSHRATILIGYGAFGLDVLRRLLASTAPRGVLSWEEPRGGGGPSERHLQDLALLWQPDPLLATREQMDHENAQEGAALEMMRDLYRQIRQIGGEGERADESFSKTLLETAETLLSAAGRAGRQGALPLGLDVIVLARPTGREVVGTLDRLMSAGIERLANHANLRRAVQGAEALNFLAIFDFDNYWDRSPRGRGIRRAVHDSVEQWQKRRNEGKPAFGRFYLVDSLTDDGVREAFHRIDEISLFLEFLLFEDQRGGDVRRLYQPGGAHESALATFGIRLVERSAGLLAHLAAARFGVGWLDYLAETGPHHNTRPPLELRRRLEPFAADALDRLVDADALHGEVASEFARLEREVTSLPVELPDWPERVRERYEHSLQQLEARVSAKAHAQMGEIAKEQLAGLPTELQAGINADLHDERNPVALGAVIADLEALLERLGAIEDVQPPPADAAEKLLRDIESLHGRYAEFHRERIDVDGLRRWWPMLAIALAAGLTPLANELLGDVPPPDATRFLLNRAYAALQTINNPLLVGLAVFSGAWGIGAAALQRSIAGRIDRTRRFYSDEERGRFVDRLRSGLEPGGALRGPIDHLIERLIATMALSIRGEVTREVGRVLTRLKERRREMRWLRGQLRGFLGMHGFSGDDLRPDRDRLDRNGAGIRYAMERAEDFQAMLSSNLPVPDRFSSTQAREAPFAGWDDRYSRSFLVPLEFLDRLSRIYKDPFEQELARPGKGPQQQRIASELQHFLETRGHFNLAFRFEAQEGVSPAQSYCLFPPFWQRLEGVRTSLSGLAMSDNSILTGPDNGRGYLLRLQTGIDPQCLVELE